MKKLSVTASVLAAILVCVLLIMFNQKKTIDPEQRIKLINGKTVKLQHLFLERDVLMVFWATNCSSCMLELPKLDQEKRKYNKFDVIAVAMQYDDLYKVKNYVTAKNYNFIFAYDDDGSIAKNFDDVNLTPTTFKISKKGVIEKKIIGDIEIFSDQKNQS